MNSVSTGDVGCTAGGSKAGTPAEEADEIGLSVAGEVGVELARASSVCVASDSWGIKGSPSSDETITSGTSPAFGGGCGGKSW
jgi:hypothetical protein